VGLYTFAHSQSLHVCPGVRLVGSSLNINNTGRLEVNHDGVWGTVCSDLFDYVDAGVVCNSLGYGLVLFSIIPLLENTPNKYKCNVICWHVLYSFCRITPVSIKSRNNVACNT